jgi:hypothetical protein
MSLLVAWEYFKWIWRSAMKRMEDYDGMKALKLRGKLQGSLVGISFDVGLFPANTLIRSSGDLRSRSSSKLLLRKRPSFLDSRRFAKESPTRCL